MTTNRKLQIKPTMLEMFMVTDEHGEVIDGPFFFRSEAAEWIEENGSEQS
jgi:hypothetical protein